MATTPHHHNPRHRATRRAWTARLAAGEIIRCPFPECRKLIDPTQPWDLAHDDDNPGRYLGPAHPHCNRSRSLQSPNRKTPHNWSKAYKIMTGTGVDREAQRRAKIEQRELARRQRRLILPS
jgi:hypothetical protein